jgi:hypothetical protein
MRPGRPSGGQSSGLSVAQAAEAERRERETRDENTPWARKTL